ncbi:MAG: N-6 DNA methylase [Deltaproteobacteria bacterium]|nr:N-6 DNA methylase [Deltaproteobacteria bacterium]
MPLKIGDTEPAFKQRVVEMINSIIRERGLGFERAEAEQSVAVGRKHLFCDGVLWKASKTTAVCEMELKRPFLEVADIELVNNAATKANAIGAPYFLTWNVRDLALWQTFEEGKPLLERRCCWWPNIVDVADLNDLREHHWERIRGFLTDLLDQLDGLYNRGTRFERLAIDEFFVRKLSSVVATNCRIYSTLIRQKCEASRSYYAALRKWTAEHGWWALLQPEVAKTDPGAFEVLGRLVIFLLMNRVIFYNLVRSQHPALPKMRFKGLRSGRDFEVRLQGYFRRVLEIDVFDQLVVPDRAVPQLERFVADLNAYDFATLDFEILGRVYETLIPEKERHALGQYFTPPTTVDLINAFCIRRAEDVVLDPACGAGTFLVRAHARLNELRPRPHRSLLEQLWGIDIGKFPAHIATMNLVLPDLSEQENFPYVIATDAFDVRPTETEWPFPPHQALRYPAHQLGGMTDVMVKIPEFDAVVHRAPEPERQREEEDPPCAQGGLGAEEVHGGGGHLRVLLRPCRQVPEGRRAARVRHLERVARPQVRVGPPTVLPRPFSHRRGHRVARREVLLPGRHQYGDHRRRAVQPRRRAGQERRPVRLASPPPARAARR